MHACTGDYKFIYALVIANALVITNNTYELKQFEQQFKLDKAK